MIRTILTDIEGTTSSIYFVKDVLFPHAARQMRDFLQEHWQDPAVQEQVQAAARESGEPLDTVERADALLQRWIAEDRKITPLKALQGMIWRAGYESGAYTAHMYPDATACLRAWHARGLALYVYSSGSVAAQKLFFRYSDDGDLTPLFSGYFDTTIGGKREAESYRRIQAQLGCPAGDILFLSDVPEELDAAREAGFRTVLLDRDGTAPASTHPRVTRFDEIDLERI